MSGLAPRCVVAICACFFLLLAMIAAPAVAPTRAWLAKRNPLLLGAVALVPYLVYASGCGVFGWEPFLRLAAIAILPTLLYALLPVRNPDRFAWQDAVAWSFCGLFLLLHGWDGAWSHPKSLDFLARMYLAAVFTWCWSFARPVPGLGYRFSVSGATLRTVAVNFTLFAAIAIPVSFWLGFAAWNPRWRGWADFAVRYAEILLFIALLEELLFRGVLQSLLTAAFASANRAQALVACLFGLSHILHGPAPNWRYVILASIAGWFYGSAFRKGGNLLASSLLHALVDNVWRTFFLKPLA